MPKVPYMYAKRALCVFQKSPIKEPCHHEKRPDTDMLALLRTRKRFKKEKIDVMLT